MYVCRISIRLIGEDIYQKRGLLEYCHRKPASSQTCTHHYFCFAVWGKIWQQKPVKAKLVRTQKVICLQDNRRIITALLIYSIPCFNTKILDYNIDSFLLPTKPKYLIFNLLLLSELRVKYEFSVQRPPIFSESIFSSLFQERYFSPVLSNVYGKV